MKVEYDPKVEALARWVLDNEYGGTYDARLLTMLAGTIQLVIDNWLENEPKPTLPNEPEDYSGQGDES